MLLRFSIGTLITLLISSLFERLLSGSGRWFPGQIPTNLDIIFDTAGITERILQTLQFLLLAPLSLPFFGGSLLIIALLWLRFKNPMIFAFGLPLLSSLCILAAFLRRTAFEITASSQGLFFALPWIAISLLPLPDRRRRDDPLLILGWGYIALAFLLGPVQPGMHWGPRFLYPALLPLLLRSVRVLRLMPARSSKLLMATTGLAALLYTSGSLMALTERGLAGREVLRTIKNANNSVLILDRWHEGADLEPLWEEMSLLWPQGPGDREELLIGLEKEGLKEGIGWLMQTRDSILWELPITVEREHRMPDRAGWTGTLLEIALTDSTDVRWGQLYWHAARRSAEANVLSEALLFFRRAVAILPESADLHYDLAVCLGRMGQITAAAAELQEALRLDPHHQPARDLWGRLASP